MLAESDRRSDLCSPAQQFPSDQEAADLVGAGADVIEFGVADQSFNRVQPETRGENQSGYNNTSWADHAVTVTVA